MACAGGQIVIPKPEKRDREIVYLNLGVSFDDNKQNNAILTQ